MPLRFTARRCGHASFPELGEAVEVVVAVVQVVDDADVADPSCFEPGDDGELVLRLAEPAAVVVEADLCSRAAAASAAIGLIRCASVSTCAICAASSAGVRAAARSPRVAG